MAETGHSSRARTMSSKDHDLIVAEIHDAINKLGGSARPATPDEAQRALRGLGADSDLISIVDSWQDTLPDQDILQLLRNWNPGACVVSDRLRRCAKGRPALWLNQTAT